MILYNEALRPRHRMVLRHWRHGWIAVVVTGLSPNSDTFTLDLCLIVNVGAVDS